MMSSEICTLLKIYFYTCEDQVVEGSQAVGILPAGFGLETYKTGSGTVYNQTETNSTRELNSSAQSHHNVLWMRWVLLYCLLFLPTRPRRVSGTCTRPLLFNFHSKLFFLFFFTENISRYTLSPDNYNDNKCGHCVKGVLATTNCSLSSLLRV